MKKLTILLAIGLAGCSAINSTEQQVYSLNGEYCVKTSIWVNGDVSIIRNCGLSENQIDSVKNKQLQDAAKIRTVIVNHKSK